MSKNILIVSSSLSGTRNTKKLCEQFKKGSIESSNNVELLELEGKKINYCFSKSNTLLFYYRANENFN